MNEKIILSSKELDRKLTRIVHEIIENNNGVKNVAIVGIKTRGEFLGKRIVKKIKSIEKKNIPFGTLDITLYRDDLRNSLTLPELKETNIPFNVDQASIILVDDVLFTGRTIRAAIDAILDFGRPSSIQLAVLIDRGLRELPIQPDYVGINIETNSKQKINVFLKETDGEEKVVLMDNNEI